MTTDLLQAPHGPALEDVAPAWRDAVSALRESTHTVVTLNRGWDLAREGEQWHRSVDAGREHLSVRVQEDEVIIGPLWREGTDSGCAGCAELRERVALEHPLADHLELPRSRATATDPLLLDLLGIVAAHLVDEPLRPGELYAVSADGVRRHRVPRSFRCPLCGPTPAADLSRRPASLVLQHQTTHPANPTRGDSGGHLLAPGALHSRVVDSRFGPVQTVMRELGAPFAMSMAVMPDAAAWGHGRALTFAEADPVGLLEVYERLGGFPFDRAVFMDLPYSQVADRALDPSSLGGHTQEQLDHPSCRVLPFTPDTPMDWVWGHDYDDREPVLVPAEVGFYQYEYRYRLDRRAARAARALDPRDNRKHFYESSSGCAVGSTLEEATLHSLLELAERDAFLLAWHRATPLPRIDPFSITHPDSRALMDLIDARGFDVHLLVATQDIDLPIVWVMAVNRAHALPATFHSGGSGASPETAIRGALREVAQLVTDPVDTETSDIKRMLEDPWSIEELVHHPRYHMHPANMARATMVLGGPVVELAEAFPGWPGRLVEAAAGDVRRSLDYVRGLFTRAGLDRLVIVDQTTREHSDIGVSVVKSVVPGIIPMCFGMAQQRLLGLPRLTAALAGTAQAGRDIPLDPHPFP